jgi:hypothetical protein
MAAASHALTDGQATLYSGAEGFPGPKLVPVRLTLVIDSASSRVTLADFAVDPIEDIPSEFGPLTLHVTLFDGALGRFEPTQRSLDVELRLAFTFLLFGSVRVADAELALRASTATAQRPDGTVITGWPVAADGVVRLVANGQFVSGRLELHGKPCSLEVDGRLQPAP